MGGEKKKGKVCKYDLRHDSEMCRRNLHTNGRSPAYRDRRFHF